MVRGAKKKPERPLKAKTRGASRCVRPSTSHDGREGRKWESRPKAHAEGGGGLVRERGRRQGAQEAGDQLPGLVRPLGGVPEAEEALHPVPWV